MSRDWTREEFGITDNTPVVDIDSLERKCERLQKQLDIAVWALYLLLSGIKTIKIGKSEELIETYALNKIEELNK